MSDAHFRPLDLPCYVAGEAVRGEGKLEVTYPWDGSLAGTVAMAERGDLERAIRTARAEHEPLTRHACSTILFRARELLSARADEFRAPTSSGR